MTNRRVAILGAGNMGRALIAGLLRSGTRAEQLAVGEAYEPARAALAREFGVDALSDNAAAVAGAQVVLLAVKPQDAERVLTPLKTLWGAPPPLLVSVAAGVRSESLASWCPPGMAVVRAMPNRPALLGAGISGLYAPPSVAPAARSAAAQLLGSVGEVVWVSTEDLLDVVTAVS